MMKVDRRQFVKIGGTLLLSALAPWEAFCLPGGVPVLVYHDIADRYGDPATITPALFSAQMEWLYANGYQAVSVRDIPGREGDGKSVVLTFDDGYASYMDYAFPLFRDYGFRSTLNIIGSRVGRFLNVEGNRPLLSWDEYRYLLDSGRVELGCRTHELHDEGRRGATGVSGKKLEEDLGRFREEFERETGGFTDILAWPFGQYDRERIEIAQKAGFRYFLTDRDEPSGATASNLLEIPRKSIGNRNDLVSFRAAMGA
jgi:peptidoglycan/xylan/chitin deacetylase (PgdA/CDA1 family)